MRVLAEIPSRPSPDLRTGTLRRCDLEAFGGLLGRLDGARTVLVTGAGPRQRLAAAGLAAAAAARGTHTALLECNFAAPGLADALGIANAPGLREYIEGAADAAAVLTPVVLAGPGSAAATEPLVCVVAGRPSTEAPRLLASDGFARALAGLSAAYDLLVLEGPPLGEEEALRLLAPHAAASIACLGPDEPRTAPIPLAGLVIQH